METKLIEVRDRATRVHVMAVMLFPKNDGEKFILDSSGFGYPSRIPLVFMTNLENDLEIWRDSFQTETQNPYARTFPEAHKELEKNWEKYKSGDVLDVEFVLGETEEPKKSDRFWTPSDRFYRKKED